MSVSELIPSSLIIASTKPLARWALRLHAERKAGQIPSDAKLMELTLNQTYQRLRGGKDTDSLWQNYLQQIGHEYIAPDFLKTSAVQEWLADSSVKGDLMKLAKTTIMKGSEKIPTIQNHLALSYSSFTGEASHLAAGPTQILVSILVAGYIASIPKDQQPLAGMLQELSVQFNERFDQAENEYISNLESIFENKQTSNQRFATEYAETELSKILSVRILDHQRAHTKLQRLLERATSGDLIDVNISAKSNIKYWTARLCANDPDTLGLAKELRDDIKHHDPKRDLSIVDASIAATNGEIDEALHIIREADDPESRSVLFSLISVYKGRNQAFKWMEKQTDCDNTNFFTPIGWVFWAIQSCALGKWKCTLERLARLESYWDEIPVLSYFEGRINAAMLLPSDRQNLILDCIPFYTSITPNQGIIAENYHSRAKVCFEYSDRYLRDLVDHNTGNLITDWLLWLRLMNPRMEDANIARVELSRNMTQGAYAVRNILFTRFFEISFDVDPLKSYMEERQLLGGLNNDELLAECILAEQLMEPRELVNYLEQNKSRLIQILSTEFLSTMHAQALIEDGHTQEKVLEVTNYYDTHNEDYVNRLNTFIGLNKGQKSHTDLEKLYNQTGNSTDLRNLISYLKTQDDRTALQPLCREYFKVAPTVDSAFDVVLSLSSPLAFDHSAIIDFLDKHSDLVEQSDDLKIAKALALFFAGQFEESRIIIESLLNRSTNLKNLSSSDSIQLSLNIAISSGNWERIGGILDRAWGQRESHDAESLMAFAQLAGHTEQMSARALEFAELAVSKAPVNPEILAAAFGLNFELGYDTKADSSLIERAAKLSSVESGPIWRLELQEIINDWLPKRRDHVREIERKWLAGEVPMSLAADSFNVSLVRLLLHIPAQNCLQEDKRNHVLLPIVSDTRDSVDLANDWVVGLDVTSIIVLHYLGLLNKTFDMFNHVKLSFNTMEYLYREQQEVRFHQPSRIESAKVVIELVQRKKLLVDDTEVSFNQELFNEIGDELATLCQLAKVNNGCVVCALPIYKVGSLMEQQADMNLTAGVVVSVLDFFKLLYDRGKINNVEFQRASSYLGMQNQISLEELPISILEGTIYIQQLAFNHLLNAKILLPIISAGLDVRIYPNALGEMHALVQEGTTAQRLNDEIYEIRDVLRMRIEEGKVSFLPRASEQYKHHNRDIRFDITTSLLEGIKTCDAFCIDDSFINRYKSIENLPTICVLDVLRLLNTQKGISENEYLIARQKLRQGGFTVIPLEFEELISLLKKSIPENGHFVETINLRTIRQSFARNNLQKSGIDDVTVSTAKLSKIFRNTMINLWEDLSITPNNAEALANWVWRYLVENTIPIHDGVPFDSYARLTQIMLPLNLGSLLLPMPSRPKDRQAQFNLWIETSILLRLWPANSDIVKSALRFVKEVISGLEINQSAYGQFLLENLPESARRMMINEDADYSRMCGYKLENLFSIGSDIELVDSELFLAAEEVFETSNQKSIIDRVGNELLLDLNLNDQTIIVELHNDDRHSIKVKVPELTLLSLDNEARIESLRKIIRNLGPTAKDFRYLLKEIRNRKPNHQEISTILGESTNGVSAVQAKLVRMFQDPLSIKNLNDLIPASVSYFERFSGPNPNSSEPEEYLQNTLTSYRKEIIGRDLKAGLEICCLGSLRDDLSPGQWVLEIDDDSVWNALESSHVTSDPFSLLGALDVALYRQHDSRFLKFSEEAILKLLNNEFEQKNGTDFYRLLAICIQLVLNRINLLENGPDYPGYWKRMSAIMHACFITRNFMTSSFTVNIDSFEQQAVNYMTLSGYYANLIDARNEPMLIAANITPGRLKEEILGRLSILKMRHENEGRQIPKVSNFNQVIEALRDQGFGLKVMFPGPLQGHKQPVLTLSQEVSQIVEGQITKYSKPLQILFVVSQVFALSSMELEKARMVINSLAADIKHLDNQSEEKLDLEQIELASQIAAPNRDVKLADSIAKAVIEFSPRISEEQMPLVITIMLQAAVAHEDQEEWQNWLEEKFAEIAYKIPSKSSDVLRCFLSHLDEIENILPADTWFHLRARRITLSVA